MSEGKRWWMSSGGLAVYCDSAPLPMGTEVRVVPLSAVVLEEGSREWGVVMAMRGLDVSHKGARFSTQGHDCEEILYGRNGKQFESGWYLLPASWVAKKDEEVNWTRREHHGTGTYYCALEGKYSPYRHQVVIGGSYMGVESVSKLEEP